MVLFDNTQEAAADQQLELCVNDSKFWLRFFTKAYMLQEVDCSDLSKAFKIYLKHLQHLDSGNVLFQVILRISRWLKPPNDIETAKLNIAAHYDTSNGHFTHFLSL
ncbi:uncharacterized protein ACLA_004050 [Aspergillus clavatus NRRL 1]|uniref:Uncharacterized protein n=1 Tax=Aspergillus clavatus (strain ATCC 1007 / CBS 513.65 / DSM 816 / NCTC 3887 / NRRL 1 / QM 1276 / 107) TaxID=344612 RepID=A1C5M3_ASPCL|nr:uncharacterized protein ACLA_004050 [Aspergillus clavatus NRRL 1]EAW14991.1 hypothetical protein ACLA_004050 [Aspergillus clavatus NRRL 1]